MPKRKREPDEALGPSLDGLDQIERLELALRPPPPEPEVEEEPEETEEQKPQKMLIFGNGPIAAACAELAAKCGFIVNYAALTDPDPALQALAVETFLLDDDADIATACGIDGDCHVCIFTDNAGDCEYALKQCLDSNAAYIGVWAGKQLRKEIFAKLKEDGAPDAELAAVCCPMGLGIGSETPEQDAVAVVAEMLAARSGVLKRLRQL